MPERKGLRVGLQFFQMLSIALNYIKVLFMMLFLFFMGGSYLHYLHYVFVVNPSQLIMLHMELSPLLCHSEIRDIVGVFTEVCSGVDIEPVLQALSSESLHYHTSNTEENAHLDIVARGVWDCTQQNTFLN